MIHADNEHISCVLSYGTTHLFQMPLTQDTI